ncbi:MAG: hypothetical protein HHJ09_14420 [Glaciimonas sp.]|nr:hypothetical protein [Glaciimonas sp.]
MNQITKCQLVIGLQRHRPTTPMASPGVMPPAPTGRKVSSVPVRIATLD